MCIKKSARQRTQITVLEISFLLQILRSYSKNIPVILEGHTVGSMQQRCLNFEDTFTFMTFSVAAN